MRRIRIRESDCPRWRSGSALSPIPLSHPFRAFWTVHWWSVSTSFKFDIAWNSRTFRRTSGQPLCIMTRCCALFFSLHWRFNSAVRSRRPFLVDFNSVNTLEGLIWMQRTPSRHPPTNLNLLLMLFVFFLVLCVRVCSISMRYVHNCGAHSHLSWCVHVCFCGLFNVEWLSIYRYALWDAHIIRSPSAWPLPDRDKKPNQIY